MSSEDAVAGREEKPAERLIGARLPAQHVLQRGEELEPGVYRIEYDDDATVVCEFGYATITSVAADGRPMIAEQPLARVDGQYVPAAEYPDAEVVVEEGELYTVDQEGSR